MFEEAIGEHPADPDAPCEQPAPEGHEASAEEEAVPNEPKDTPAEPDEEAAPAESPPPKNQIVIGLDGKTPDGAMPYQILRDKLEWLK